MVLDLDGRAEYGQEAVAAIRDERAAVLEDRVARLVEISVQRVDHELRRPAFGQGREAPEVGEHDRARRSHAAEPEVVVGAGENVVDDVLGEEAREDVVDAGALEVVKPLLREPGVDPAPAGSPG